MTIEASKLDDSFRKSDETLFSGPRSESQLEPRFERQIAVKGRFARYTVHACANSRICRAETRPFTVRFAKNVNFSWPPRPTGVAHILFMLELEPRAARQIAVKERSATRLLNLARALESIALKLAPLLCASQNA